MIKQWHEKKITEPTKEWKEKLAKREVEPYILKNKIKTTKRDKEGNISITFETKKKNIFAKISETEKSLKQTQMQELLKKLDEIEKGI